MNRSIFIAGGTGYIGTHLIPKLLQNNWEVKALARSGSEHKLPPGCEVIIGNALNPLTFESEVNHSSTYIHLVGVPHPSPSKKELFQHIDLTSVRSSIAAMTNTMVSHVIFISVAPSEVMKDYSDVRKKSEMLFKIHCRNGTFLRPFYVLGPGHHWPLLLTPFYKLMMLTKSGREKARKLGLVWLGQIVNAIVWAVENPADGFRIMEVSDIRKFPGKL
jgi:nucleoside-diphosphate-sugar epimerase